MQYVIDALHLGNKLKFANHSPNPNCHASIIKVGGDHHVSIFAKERIEAGQEIFYDYCYEPEQSPSWARKPDDANRGPSSAPHARSKKPQQADPKEGPSVPPQAKFKKPRPHR
ncbi:putative histone-lysine N-methyltransferase chromatin remodeling SET family [Helianthus annuus]|nr:putative histone-lysine N-methyltransferase chromatin remodeling SET family [Helianthus annuus]